MAAQQDYIVRNLTKAELNAASKVYMDAYLAAEREDGRKVPKRNELKIRAYDQFDSLKKQFKSVAGGRKFGALRGVFSGDDLLGYVSYGALSRAKGQAEIFEIYVASAHWHKGLGKILFNEAVTDLRDAGFTSMQLMTKRQYKRANAFYRALGGEESAFRSDTETPPTELGKHLAKALRALAIYRWDLTDPNL